MDFFFEIDELKKPNPSSTKRDETQRNREKENLIFVANFQDLLRLRIE
jgi:hypothetical protein